MLPLPIFLNLLVGLGLDMYLFMDVVCGVSGVVWRVLFGLCGMKCGVGMEVSDPWSEGSFCPIFERGGVIKTRGIIPGPVCLALSPCTFVKSVSLINLHPRGVCPRPSVV